ncbi:MAG: hypothetical protein L0212_07950 [Acidobacteria bacterium]|nr:hypothetical protein [Acidobacteriota bacterium]
MTEFPLSFENARSQAMARVTEAMLRALGAAEVTIRLPLNIALPNADLGLATPGTEDVVIKPAVLRSLPSTAKERGRVELLVAASTVAEQAVSRNAASPEALLDGALGIVHNHKLLRIRSVDAHAVAEDPCFYRITAAE